jgi:hypothetical protein
MGVRLALLPREGEVVEVLLGPDGAVTQRHHLGARLQVGGGQLLGRVLQLEAVDEDHVGPGEGAGRAGRRFEGVGVDALGHEPPDLNPVAGDVRHDAGEGRDGGDDVQLGRVVGRLGSARAARRPDQGEGDGDGCENRRGGPSHDLYAIASSS